MKSERRDIEFPMWRKKVDRSLFEHNGTTIPKWVGKMWEIERPFPELLGKGDPNSNVEIGFDGEAYVGQVTCSWPKKRSDKVYRLWFGDDLKGKLKDTFLMSFMRDIEARLRADNQQDIETEIPFWEFLDIEFDTDRSTFRFYAHYTQRPIFPELFKRLTYSPAMKRIDDEIGDKGEFRIYKQDWKPRSEFETEIGVENVVYTLADSTNRLIYVGEPTNLIKRFRQGHTSIKDWDYYRYDVLPSSFGRQERVTIERMVIRSMASLIPNKAEVACLNISDFKLTNDKIDS